MAHKETTVRNLFLVELAKQLIVNRGMISNPLFQPLEITEIKSVSEEKDYLPSPLIIDQNYTPETPAEEKTITIKEIGEPLRQKMLQPIKEPPIVQVQYTTSWGKLNDLMNSPQIESIECSGPDKPLIIGKEGKQIQTQIFLTNDEIKKLLQTISHEAHMPIDAGILKAETPSYLATAVISEFVGSRFFVQKKHPIIR